MDFNPQEIDQKAIYKLLTGIVIPRPIGWVSSISEDGIANLAPFSFFNAVGDDPPHVMFSASASGTANKDTLNNVLTTKEFVVNMVTEALTEKMNMTAHPVPTHESEFDFAGVTAIASLKVKPPRVKESPVALECQLVHHYMLEDNKNGGSTILIGRVVMFHVDDSILLDDYKIDVSAYKPVSRLAGHHYSKLGELFSIKRT